MSSAGHKHNVSQGGTGVANIPASHLIVGAGKAPVTFAEIITASAGIGSNDNDDSLPTSAAVKAYADTAVAAVISDTAYDATSWNGVTTIAPSKNAVRDKFESLQETGTWTPVPFGSSTAGSPSGTFEGRYVKSGNLVYIACQIVITDLDTMAGQFQISGLPYGVAGSTVGRGGISVGFRNGFANDFPFNAFISGSQLQFYRSDIDNTTLAISDMSNGATMYFNMVYET